jgi:hypothetical protein
MFIDDGFPTRMTFSQSASAALYFAEKSITPPGFEGGGPNDTTTMRNVRYRTRAPKKLITLTDGTMECKYDPKVFQFILDQLQVNQQITVTFPDTTTMVFWGWIDNFKPGAIQEGGMALTTVTVCPSNQNDSQVETAPTLPA